MRAWRIALPALVLAGGYAAQVAWSRHIAALCVEEEIRAEKDPHAACLRVLAKWRTLPPWGCRDAELGWVPRRAYWELFRKMTGRDFPPDPMAWSAWLTANPRLAWDEKKGHLEPIPQP